MRIERQFLSTLCVGLGVLWLTAGVASAQSFQGGMRGSVKDAQGVIPGVTVTLTGRAPAPFTVLLPATGSASVVGNANGASLRLDVDLDAPAVTAGDDGPSLRRGALHFTMRLRAEQPTPTVDASIALPGVTAAFLPALLRTLAPVIVAPKDHPLAKLKKIAPNRLRGLPLHGLGRVNFPEYAPRLRAILKPFGVTPQFAEQSADGVASLFAALEANRSVAVLSDGIAAVLPPSLVMIPFSPALANMVVKIGMPSVRPSLHAEAFARFLREAV